MIDMREDRLRVVGEMCKPFDRVGHEGVSNGGYVSSGQLIGG